MNRPLATPNCSSWSMWHQPVLFGVLLLSGAAAMAQSPPAAEGRKHTPAAADAAGPQKSSKKSSQKSPTPKVLPSGSGETSAQRAVRLKRECKGLPNAGACTGYTQ
jgi:hypothetical protein